MDCEIENLKEIGVKFETNVVVGKSITINQLKEDGFDAVFISSGAGLPKMLNIEGENLNGVYSANEFLTRVNLMQANCKDCSTPLKIGEKVAIIAAGNFFGLGRQVKEELKKHSGIDATLINPRFLTGVDSQMLEGLKANHSVVITLEDGELDGGFGEKVTRFYGNSSMKVLNFGSRKEFTDRVPLEELYNRYHLTKELIVEDIKGIL